MEHAGWHPEPVRTGRSGGGAGAVEPAAAEPRRADPRTQGLSLRLPGADHQWPVPLAVRRCRQPQATWPGRRARRAAAQEHRAGYRTPARHAAPQRWFRPVERRERGRVLVDRLRHRLPPARPRAGLRRAGRGAEESQRSPAALPAAEQPDRGQLQSGLRAHPFRRAGLCRLRVGAQPAGPAGGAAQPVRPAQRRPFRSAAGAAGGGAEADGRWSARGSGSGCRAEPQA